MFQLFWRPRAHNYFKTRLGNRDFRARSIDRDANTDRSRVNSILEAIENALSAAEQERSGLNRRVEDALARAAVTIGNGIDEYLERDALDSHHQDLFSTEISNGQRRLECYRFGLGAVLCFDASRFARNGHDWHQVAEIGVL
jgi:hypothetical protein